jgi:hypothetical protein
VLVDNSCFHGQYTSNVMFEHIFCRTFLWKSNLNEIKFDPVAMDLCRYGTAGPMILYIHVLCQSIFAAIFNLSTTGP